MYPHRVRPGIVYPCVARRAITRLSALGTVVGKDLSYDGAPNCSFGCPRHASFGPRAGPSGSVLVLVVFGVLRGRLPDAFDDPGIVGPVVGLDLAQH